MKIKEYFKSRHDGSWWAIFTDDRPNRLIGQKPKKTNKPLLQFINGKWVDTNEK